MSNLFLPQFQTTTVQQRPHDYLVNGERYQRVTTALGVINKPALIPWTKRLVLDTVRRVLRDPAVASELGEVLALQGEGTTDRYDEWVDRLIASAGARPDAVRTERAALGTEVHSIIADALVAASDNLDAYMPFVPEEQQPAVRGALAFLDDHHILVAETELAVWSDELRVAGTIDGVGWCDDNLVIWDWKRSAGLYWETALQLSAYALFLTWLTGKPVQRAWAVKLPRGPVPAGKPLYETRLLCHPLEAFAAYKAALILQRASNVAWLAAEES